MKATSIRPIAESIATMKTEIYTWSGSEKIDLLYAAQRIKSWYGKHFPKDELKNEIDPFVTFEELFEAMDRGYDVYTTLGISDSLIRERVFMRLTEITGYDYETIYSMMR